MRVRFAMAGEVEHHEFADALLKFWPVVAGIGVGAWAMIRSFFADRALTEKSKDELESIARGAVKDSIAILSNDNKRLHGELIELRDEFEGFRMEQAKILLSKDGEIAMLRGEVRGILATALSFASKLDAAGIDHEKISPHYWDVSGYQIKEMRVQT
jgi:hypothetical protein